MEIRDSSNKYFLSWTRLFSFICSVCLCLHGFLKDCGFCFVLLLLSSSYMQRRTLSNSPCCYSFWRRTLHCITMCCWSTSMRSEIHVKDSSPVLVAPRPHPAESSPRGTEIGSPKQAVRWQFLVFESGAKHLLHASTGSVKKATLDTDLSLPCSSPKRVLRPAGLMHASDGLCVPHALPQASCHSHPEPVEAYKSALAICI